MEKISDLPVDEKGHLSSNWYLATADCREIGALHFRKKGIMGNELAYHFSHAIDYCIAVCLEVGTPMSHLDHLLEDHIYIVSKTKEDDLQKWVTEKCQNVELGWFSYNENPVIVNWISPTNQKRTKMAEIQRGHNEVWVNAQLGHNFEIADLITKKSLGEYTAKHDAFYPIGHPDSLVELDIGDEAASISKKLRVEYARSRRVNRTFTELGFEKFHVPDDLWGSINTYFYNNRNSYIREAFSNKSLTLNWYQVDVRYLVMPKNRRMYWQSRLYEIVQKWIGRSFKLESININGMRRYEDGARLLMHVDRESTNAVSVIINVAQEGLRSPWMLDIYDHADRLHHIQLSPGEMLLYESARCLHGRMSPLDGGYYVNLFAHYRPKGDAEWFTRANRKGPPKPLISIDGRKIPTLSPWNHTVRSGLDLVSFWKAEVDNEL